MRTKNLLIAIGLGFWALTSALVAENEFVVIVHPENPTDSLTAAQISELFLLKKVKWDHGPRVRPIDLEPSSALRNTFSLAIHKRNADAILRYWQRQIFSGREVSPPHRKLDAEVLAFVSNRPGAIGYVQRASVTGAVKVLAVSAGAEQPQR